MKTDPEKNGVYVRAAMICPYEKTRLTSRNCELRDRCIFQKLLRISGRGKKCSRMKSGTERRVDHRDQPETEEKTMRKERRKEVRKERGHMLKSGKTLCSQNLLKSES